MHVGVRSVVSCVQYHHYHLLWPTTKVVDILLLTWCHKRFGNGGLLLVAHLVALSMHLPLKTCLLLNFHELHKGRVSTKGPLCSCRWVFAELLLDVAICCWSGLVELRVHQWEIQPWYYSAVSPPQERWPSPMPLNLLCSCRSVFLLLHWLFLCCR